ncbi:MAG: hypothetical protein ABI680_14905 [Chthoniobacteraceae bacterium]
MIARSMMSVLITQAADLYPAVDCFGWCVSEPLSSCERTNSAVQLRSAQLLAIIGTPELVPDFFRLANDWAINPSDDDTRRTLLLCGEYHPGSPLETLSDTLESTARSYRIGFHRFRLRGGFKTVSPRGVA